ncbi:MAG: hypothetical protein AAB847_01940 [Patescibacteria group bacterium]
MEKVNKNLIIGVLLILVIAFGFFWYKKETWQGFYYPDGCLVCEDKYIYSPQFQDRASCLAWATNLKSQRNNSDDAYECGKNCKAPDHPGGLYVCDETVDY